MFLASTRGRRRIQGCCETLTHTKSASLALPSRRGVILGDSSASGRMENPFSIYIEHRGAAVQCPWRHPEGGCSFGRCFPKIFPEDLQPWCGLSRPDYADRDGNGSLGGFQPCQLPGRCGRCPECQQQTLSQWMLANTEFQKRRFSDKAWRPLSGIWAKRAEFGERNPLGPGWALPSLQRRVPKSFGIGLDRFTAYI